MMAMTLDLISDISVCCWLNRVQRKDIFDTYNPFSRMKRTRTWSGSLLDGSERRHSAAGNPMGIKRKGRSLDGHLNSVDKKSWVNRIKVRRPAVRGWWQAAADQRSHPLCRGGPLFMPLIQPNSTSLPAQKLNAPEITRVTVQGDRHRPEEQNEATGRNFAPWYASPFLHPARAPTPKS